MLLFDVFAKATIVSRFDDPQWAILLKQAYGCKSVARLGEWLRAHQVFDVVPESIRWHFSSAFIEVESGHREMHQTLNVVTRHLSAFTAKVTVLKGAAYALDSQSLVGKGRRFSDVDLLILPEELQTAEQLLHWSGWHFDKDNEYDLHYYRAWMHELPPLYHAQAPLAVDLHHQLVPPVSRMAFSPALLSDHLEPFDDYNVYRLTRPVQMVHTSLHMLTNDDFSGLNRDLVDFYLLIKDSKDPDRVIRDALGFAQKANVETHLKRAVRLASRLFGNIISDDILQQVRCKSPVERWVDSLYLGVIEASAAGDTPRETWQQWVLWCRAHYLKMAMPVLVTHAMHKLRGLVTQSEKTSQASN